MTCFCRGGTLLDEAWLPDPRELASVGQIIVVTVQYRLGPFGFLFMGQRNPGEVNPGVLDAQVWSLKNILSFFFHKIDLPMKISEK